MMIIEQVTVGRVVVVVVRTLLALVTPLLQYTCCYNGGRR
jgi:hypothetical protein